MCESTEILPISGHGGHGILGRPEEHISRSPRFPLWPELQEDLGEAQRGEELEREQRRKT